MIDLYAWQTSNCQRVAILLEECGLPYRMHKVDLFKGEQQSPEFLKLNPAAAVPVIVDADGPGGKPLTLTQSGAIDVYLAEKSGKFLPSEGLARVQTMQWLMFTLSDCAAASMALFLLSVLSPEKSPPNISLFEQRIVRMLRVADGRLAGPDYLADELSIADFALYPVYAARKALVEGAGGMPNLERWAGAIAARPAVVRAMQAAA